MDPDKELQATFDTHATRTRPLDLDEYSRIAAGTEADQTKILERMWHAYDREGVMRLDNGARGLCSDAGEVAAAVMKYIEYGRPLDVVNLKEEVGDCLWRLDQICRGAGFTLRDAMEANARKLRVRYPAGYTDAAAANRDRAAEARAVDLGGRFLRTPHCCSRHADNLSCDCVKITEGGE